MIDTPYRLAGIDDVAKAALLLVLWLCPAAAAESYSPNVDDAYPDNVYWGDTHLHSYLSGDAFALGSRITPDDAYRFAKGETVRSTSGQPARLRRALGFLMVADHAENFGVLPLLAANPAALPETESARNSARIIAALPPLADVLNAGTTEEFHAMRSPLGAAKSAWMEDYAIGESFRRDMWSEVIRVAEKHNDPGTFTAFVGYEWTAAGAGEEYASIHRNVLFADGPELTGRTLPFSSHDSRDPEDLWAYLADYEDRLGGNAISIPHNSNLSLGQMFGPSDYGGAPLTPSYASTRARFEPVVEVTQYKGDSETHPLASPNDTFADFERNWRPPGTNLAVARQSYARPALGIGLDLAAELGVNPFKFGMIGQHRLPFRPGDGGRGQLLGHDGNERTQPLPRVLQFEQRGVGLRGGVGAGEYATGRVRRHEASRSLCHHGSPHDRCASSPAGTSSPGMLRTRGRRLSATARAYPWAAT